MTTFRNTALTLAHLPDALAGRLDTFCCMSARGTREGQTARGYALAASLLAGGALYSHWLATLSPTCALLAGHPGGVDTLAETVVLAGAAALSLLAAAWHGVRAYRARIAARIGVQD